VSPGLSGPTVTHNPKMLRLRVASDSAATPVVPAPDEPGVEVWRHTDGTVIAYGGSSGREHWMQLLNVGLFVFGEEADVVTAFPEADAAPELVEDGFRRAVLPMALQVLGRDVLHASAVLGRGGVIAFCAVSETGKSTVAYALGRRGYRLWADDALAFRIDAAAVTAVPLAFTLRLRPATSEFYGVNGEAPVVQPAAAERLTAVCVLERSSDGDDDAPVERLTGADAFAAVLPHAYCFSLADDARKARMTASYLELVDRIPVFRVRVRSGLEHLQLLLDRIEEAVGLGPAA
jgi:hypothetical protein